MYVCKSNQDVILFGQAVVAGRKKGKTLEVGWDLSMGVMPGRLHSKGGTAVKSSRFEEVVQGVE